MPCTANQCGQGRRECPCPDACRLADREDERRGVQALAVLLVVSVGAVSILAAFVLALTT